MTNRSTTLLQEQEDLRLQMEELKAKQAAVRTKNAAFLAEADARKEELMARWEVATGPDPKQKEVLDAVDRLAGLYGCTVRELFAHVGSEQQIRYYRTLRTRG